MVYLKSYRYFLKIFTIFQYKKKTLVLEYKKLFMLSTASTTILLNGWWHLPSHLEGMSHFLSRDAKR